MSGLKSSQSGEVGMKQSGVDKRREKVRLETANKMENDDGRTTGCEVLKGVILENQRLNRGP